MLNQTLYLSSIQLFNTRKGENRVYMTIGRILKIYKNFRSTIKIGVLAIIIFIKLGNGIKEFWNSIVFSCRLYSSVVG